MSCIRNFGLSILLTIGASASFASPLAELTQRLSGWNGLSAHFTQSIVDADGHMLQQTSGDLDLLRPGQLRWITDEPYPQLLISDGDTLWLYDPDLEQVTIKPVTKALADTPAFILSGDTEQIDQEFTVTILPTGSTAEIRFGLTPKSTSSSFESLEMTFTGTLLTAFAIKDTLSQTTSILFTNVRLRDAFEPDTFTFTPPEGTDILHDD